MQIVERVYDVTINIDDTVKEKKLGLTVRIFFLL